MIKTPIEKLLKERKDEIDAWFASQWGNRQPLIYLSCDIRHSGFKFSVVDTNLFPAGFNNLCSAYSKRTTDAFNSYLGTTYPLAKKILIFGEEHTRNKFYLNNLCHLHKLIGNSGRDVAIGVLGDYMMEPRMTLDLDGHTVVLNKIQRQGSRIRIEDSWEPDLIISNNDFSAGVPEVLQNLEQTIIPSPSLGWHRRHKSDHFRLFRELMDDFGSAFGIDPWRLLAYADSLENVDLSDEASLLRLADHVETLLQKIQAKYDEYGIGDAPYVYIKNNSGTYGMGLLPVFSRDEVLTLNRKKRNKLQSTKGGGQASSFLIQEGIPTVDSYSGYPIEPVIYAVGKEDVGGFFRIHESKNQLESLNAPGMTFSCLCLHKLNEPHEDYFLDCHQKESLVEVSRFLVKVAALAAAREG